MLKSVYQSNKLFKISPVQSMYIGFLTKMKYKLPIDKRSGSYKPVAKSNKYYVSLEGTSNNASLYLSKEHSLKSFCLKITTTIHPKHQQYIIKHQNMTYEIYGFKDRINDSKVIPLSINDFLYISFDYDYEKNETRASLVLYE